MQEVCLELIKSAKERFKYPIISIYVIVLVIWNWDVLSYYFLSTSSVEEKIQHIENTYTDSAGRVLWPLLKAIVLAIIVPGIMYLIELSLSTINSRRRVLRYKNNDAIRAEKLSIAKNEFLIEQHRSGQKEIEDWQDKVRGLENRLEVEVNNNKALLKEITDNVERANETQSNLRNQIAHSLEGIDDSLRSQAPAIAEEIIMRMNFDELSYQSHLEILLEVFDAIINRDFNKVNSIEFKNANETRNKFNQEVLLPLLLESKLVSKKITRYYVTPLGYMVYEYYRIANAN